MEIESYFSRPGINREIQDRIKTDIRYAKKCIYIAQYNFTDRYILEEVIKSQALDKRIIVNHENKSKVIYEINKLLNDTLKNFKFDLDVITSLGSSEDKNKGYYESAMHHKFMIADDCLWTGSYNFSMNASLGNWENALRITNKEIVKSFQNEFFRMYSFARAITDNLLSNKCKICNEKIDDPFEHFRINVEFTTTINRSKLISTNPEWLDYIDIHNHEIYHSNQLAFKENELKKLDESKIESKGVIFSSECKNRIKKDAISECCSCNNYFSENNLHQVKVLNRINEKIIEFEPGFYPDNHERAGQSVWTHTGTPSKEVQKKDIVEQLGVCLTCFEEVFKQKNKWFNQ